MLRRLAAGAVALALVATTTTRADRGAAREADLGEKRSVAPDAALGGTLDAKKPARKEPGGPALGFEAFRKAVEVQVSDKRREEIASLRRLIELGGGSNQDTPQWYFRLAELLWEESQYFFFEANRRDDRLIALGTKGDPREIDRLMAEKKDLEAAAAAAPGPGGGALRGDHQAVPEVPAPRRGPLLPRGEPLEAEPERPGRDQGVRRAHRALPEVALRPRRVDGGRRVLVREVDRRRPGEEPQAGARRVPEGGRVPGVDGLRVRALQAGVGPLQPRGLERGARHVPGGGLLRRAADRERSPRTASSPS